MYIKPSSIIPENDDARLEKLAEYRILDTYPEEMFDNIAQLAKQIFDTPSAFISFVDKDRVFFKSNLSSLNASEVPRKDSLCSLAILQDDVLMFTDTHEIPELLDSPYVSTEGGIRFYAGAPLYTPEGFNMGTICVTDSVPRLTTPEQLQMLKSLSKIVIDKLENRLRYRKSIESQIDLMNFALHEIKNPLASISLANDILVKDISTSERMTGMIKSSLKIIQARLSDLLSNSELEEKELTLFIEEVNLKDMLKTVLSNFDLQAKRKGQRMELKYNVMLPDIQADKAKLSDIIHNLVSNSIKYSFNDTIIKVAAVHEGDNVKITVTDQGQGLSKADEEKLFTKFAKLSSKPTGKETSNGLGLSITKSFVELHHGTITARSEGKDKGTSFIVTLPIKHFNSQPSGEGQYN